MKIQTEKSFKNVIGPHLKRFRFNNNITQEELSARLEILAIYLDRSSISKIERQNRIVTDYELIAFASILKVSINLLLGLDEEVVDI